MKRKIFTYSVLVAGAMILPAMISCKGKQQEKVEETEVKEEPKTSIEPKTIQVEIFEAMPVKGDQADYFSLSYPDSTNFITVTGAPSENEYRSNSGTVKFNIDLKVLKRFNDEIYRLGDYSGLTFRFLDSDHEDVGYIRVGKTDMELIEAELGKAVPGTITLIVKDDKYESDYNKIFEKAK